MNHTPQGATLTDLILETFRVNGALLQAGDHLASPHRLSSARWQVLGAIESEALSVAQIARRMGLKRQSVHRTVAALRDLVRFSANPDHLRARLVRLTPEGRARLRAITRAQVVWSNRLAAGLPLGELERTLKVLREIRERLESGSASRTRRFR